MNNKGQSVLAEHVMIFFVVTAALVAITAFVQRTLEARIHDTRNFMITSVINSSVCDAGCMAATGGNILYEYEPYYAEEISDVQKNGMDNKGTTSGNPAVIGVKYKMTTDDQTATISTGTQLPPECADGANPKPSYCP